MQGASIGKCGPCEIPAHAAFLSKSGHLCNRRHGWRRSALVCVGWGRGGSSSRQQSIPALQTSPPQLEYRNSRYSPFSATASHTSGVAKNCLAIVKAFCALEI